MIKKINWQNATFSITTCTALLVGASCVLITQLENKIDSQVGQEIRNERLMLQDKKRQEAKIELATNPRMANIMAYLIKANLSDDFIWGNGLTTLSDALKADYIDDNIFARLKEAGAYGAEFYDVSSDIKLIRKKWYLRVQSGSHFDKSPSGSLLLPGESILIPRCKEPMQPYLAYALAAPNKQDVNFNIVANAEENQYRFTLPDVSWEEALGYRILVDVGCTSVNEAPDSEKPIE